MESEQRTRSRGRTHEPNTVDIKLSYTETKGTTWNASVSVKLGVKTIIQTGVPFIEDGKIHISAEINAAYQWGETVTSSVVKTVYKITVAPMSRIKVSLLATKGSCDVPFSYTQHDTLTNGKHITYNMDDGVYTGINCFNFKYETQQEKL
ncbi:hypothetical protein HYC85_020286 [Camellia sinensis]|uniref:Agglutinin domain-containing protein n=1 Tax=Camellia sinensis TaxID=4442 RepID=A0A7J7GT65_CAMSI|nr:hypothetical protein HYC85_020286 [Camellia sinensis]